ncbi:RNA polymerase factor sigma-54 [Vagococcus fluvialis]|uniref:RNA polymerase factor sigma-54 n=1 Tax=Vagococcus fluvialis TaxID=2738 RepID=UPI003B5A22A1
MKFEQRIKQTQQQTQKLAMTQELQQSIQMLQYNTEDLLSFLENKSLENPLLEVKIETDEMILPKKTSTSNHSDDQKTEWMEQVPDESISLFEHLINQVHLNYRETYLRKLVLYLIEFIDLNGYLTTPLEEMREKTEATEIQMLDALTLLQMLEPTGVGARSLKECLMLQIEKDDSAPNLAYIIVEEYFEELANRKWAIIQKAYDIEVFEVQDIFDYIQKLQPYPGANFSREEESYIIPDVVVKVKDDLIEVLSTKSSTPKLIFQQAYFERMSCESDKEVQEFLKTRKSEFEWLQKGVLQRGNTILRVAEEIVKHQSQFFLDPKRPLGPLQLKEVAKALSIHESTVSRSVNGKYLQTDFGMFELRSFFTTGISQGQSGEDVSTDSIKKEILDIINEEDKSKPLSDQKIVDLLLAKEIKISRRAVAKYRDELEIPASSKRKRYNRK